MNLNPTNAARRVKCPGSHKLEQPFKDSKSDYATEGIAAHWVATYMAKNPGAVVPEYTPDGEEITEEMLEGGALYAGFIQDHFKGVMNKLHFEESLNISTIHPNVTGRPDCWGVLTPVDLHLYDYKFGRSFVEVYENWQLIEYTAGILDLIKTTGLDEQYFNIHMHIIQPRSFHPSGQIRTWHVKACDLRAHFNILRSIEDEAMGDSPKTSVSSECGHCTARHVCPTLQASAMVGVDVAGSSIPHNLSPQQLATELRFLERYRDLLDSRICGLSAEALALIQRGDRVPYYQAVRGTGRDRWVKPKEQVIALGEMFGVDLKNVKVLTPKQAIAAGIDKKYIAKYYETPLGALKLSPVDTRKSDKIFGNTND